MIASTVVVVALLRLWYRRLAKADIPSAFIASSLTLWLQVVPLALVRAILKPFAPDLWASLFGNPYSTWAYAPLAGVCVAVLLVIAVPLGRDWIGSAINEPRRWAVRSRA